MNVEIVLLSKNSQQEIVAVLPSLQQAAGVCTSLVIKGYGVYMRRSTSAVTHRNSAAAEAFLEVGQMELAV